jgi:hypothetical protein
MSAPSRRPEIRRRRARADKIQGLRRQYASARNEAERSRILEKVRKVGVGMTQDQFLQPLQAKR